MDEGSLKPAKLKKDPKKWAIIGALIGVTGAFVTQIMGDANPNPPISYATGILGGAFWGAVAAWITNRVR